MKTQTLFFGNSMHTSGAFQKQVQAMRSSLHEELRRMGNLIGSNVADYLLKEISSTIEKLLDEITALYSMGDVSPFARLRVSYQDESQPSDDTTLRIGILPLAANPIHWGHIATGLEAIAELKLDKVVYIIAGDIQDSKEPALVRHAMGHSVLKLFSPLLAYSDIAYGYAFDDMTNIFRLLQLNEDRKIQAVYISGADHHTELVPDTCITADTQVAECARLKQHLSFQENMHGVSTAFVSCGPHCSELKSGYDTMVIPTLPFETSSSMIRRAIKGQEPRHNLALLPYTAYVDIRAFSLYDEKRTPVSVSIVQSETDTRHTAGM